MLDVASKPTGPGRSVEPHSADVAELLDRPAAAGARFATLSDAASLLYRERRARSVHFPRLSEHCWDMLLLLFVAQRQNQPISITALCTAGEAPLTTGLRHMDRLIDRGLVHRIPDPMDRRRFRAQLSEKGMTAMRLYLEAITGQ